MSPKIRVPVPVTIELHVDVLQRPLRLFLRPLDLAFVDPVVDLHVDLADVPHGALVVHEVYVMYIHKDR